MIKPRIRYPFAPLAAAMGLSAGAACKQLQLSGSTEQEYRRDGVSERVGDRLAAKAGFHAYTIWPEMADQAVADASKPCDECGEPFIPISKRARFCSRACYRRANSRRALDAARRRYDMKRDEIKAARRARYAENREQELEQVKARYQRNREKRLAYQREYNARRRAAARKVAA